MRETWKQSRAARWKAASTLFPAGTKIRRSAYRAVVMGSHSRNYPQATMEYLLHKVTKLDSIPCHARRWTKARLAQSLPATDSPSPTRPLQKGRQLPAEGSWRQHAGSPHGLTLFSKALRSEEHTSELQSQ